MINLRRASIKDAGDFKELVLLSAAYFPDLFGQSIGIALEKLFCHPSNLFSFNHVNIAEVEGKVAGMILGYDWRIKREEDLKTGFLLLKHTRFELMKNIGVIIKFNKKIGRLPRCAFYISNLAVYPPYRRRGVGKSLMELAVERAKRLGDSIIILDVERENNPAINLYRKAGFKIQEEFSINLIKRVLNFYRMGKFIS